MGQIKLRAWKLDATLFGFCRDWYYYSFIVLQSIEKTSEYQKRCFDTIAPTMEENRALKEDISGLQEMLQQAWNEWDAL
jgi:hypothetical protein